MMGLILFLGCRHPEVINPSGLWGTIGISCLLLPFHQWAWSWLAETQKWEGSSQRVNKARQPEETLIKNVSWGDCIAGVLMDSEISDSQSCPQTINLSTKFCLLHCIPKHSALPLRLTGLEHDILYLPTEYIQHRE